MTREIQIHVEEPSMEAFKQALLPRMLTSAVAWKIIDYGSKQQLLARLPQRLLGYAQYDAAYRPKLMVLVDRDDDDCAALKAQLETACEAALLRTKGRPADSGDFDVVNRIVVEELEAWFFGDPEALQEVWPGTRRSLGKAAYRDPDAVRGGTHEALLRVLKSAGHLRDADRLPKIEIARIMGHVLNVQRSRSSSFQHFQTGLDALLATV